MSFEKIIKNKKIKIIFFVLLSLIAVFLIVKLLFKKPPPPPPPPPPAPPWPTTYPDPRFIHYPLTEERCKSVKDPSQREMCFEDLNYLKAIWSKKIEKCLELKNAQKREDCISKVVKASAVEPDKNAIKEAEKCQMIENKKLKEQCILQAAVDSLNKEVCKHFFEDEPFEKKECLDKVKAFNIIRNTQDPYRDIKKCKEVKTLEYGTLCFRALLEKINYDCQSLEELQKQMCQSLVFKREAKTKEDCQKIPLENYRKVCERIVETGKSGFDLDSDNDGKSDEGELFYNLDPFNPDTDGDGLLDGKEILVYGTDPSNKDTDGDGVNDFDEIKLGTNPNKIDH